MKHRDWCSGPDCCQRRAALLNVDESFARDVEASLKNDTPIPVSQAEMDRITEENRRLGVPCWWLASDSASGPSERYRTPRTAARAPGRPVGLEALPDDALEAVARRLAARLAAGERSAALVAEARRVQAERERRHGRA